MALSFALSFPKGDHRDGRVSLGCTLIHPRGTLTSKFWLDIRKKPKICSVGGSTLEQIIQRGGISVHGEIQIRTGH